MLDRIFSHNWMTLPETTREALRSQLNIPRTGQTEVRTEGGGTSVLVSDGTTNDDLAHITKELLISYLDPKEEFEFSELWSMAVNKADLTLSLSRVQPEEVKIDIKVEAPVENNGDSVDSAITGDNKDDNGKEEDDEENTKE